MASGSVFERVSPSRLLKRHELVERLPAHVAAVNRLARVAGRSVGQVDVPTHRAYILEDVNRIVSFPAGS
jgi:hypothetical protein